jgi:hypothetical protein
VECCDERHAHLLDRLGGAISEQLRLSRRDVGGEQLVAQDASDPAREIVISAMVAQHPRLADRDRGLKLREVRDDRPGGGVVLRSDLGAGPLEGVTRVSG